MNIAIVGATGNVGRKIIEILEKKQINIENLFLLASKKSEGKKISYDLKYDASDYSFFSKTDMFISVFYDYGTIQQYNDLFNINLTTPNKYSLKGWGASLDLLSGQKYGLKLGWADSLSGNQGKTSSGNNSDGKDNTSRYWFLGSIKLK